MPTSIQDPLPVEAALQGPRAIKVADRCAFAIAIRAAVCTGSVDARPVAKRARLFTLTRYCL